VGCAPLGGGAAGPHGIASSSYEDILILNEMWAQDKMYVLVEIFYLHC
jgi:hypothetical protein